jgi:pimeloyl-ACP methyl ester carboxylesterase
VRDLVGLLDALDVPSVKVVGHDLGGLVAYALARLHPGRVDRLALLDAPLPLLGLEVPAWRVIEQRLWHQRFHRVPFLPEALIAGRERLYLSWHFGQTIQNIGAITSEDLDEYVRCYSQAGGLAASFAFGRAIETSAEQVRTASGAKMSIPLLFFGGAKSLAGAFKDHLGLIAADSRLLVVPDSGHWMPEENPSFVIKELQAFFEH